ncbi:M56 family metallopeptidase [Bacteroides sp.]|uniref:M56 family metallopeptidase n=1 Tax=Bacteroides sp. TaxID=29523 RepID=UPI00260DFF78|nr:M56 family metallopeptidase [Bacteroides sp.]MDD3037173.1 M56 family metallopeptidase [Bacteroides sp.]
MGEFLFYLLKSGCFLIIFYLLFKLLMSGTTFFRFNRIVLLAGILGCAFLPLIEFTTVEETLFTIPLRTIQEALGDERNMVFPDGVNWTMQKDENGSGRTVNWCPVIFGYIYFLGALFTLCWLSVSLFRMFQLIKTGERYQCGKYRLVVVSQPVSSFCWGKYIVVSASDYSRQINEILLHETMHLCYRHTLDLWLMQFFLVFYWFNPVIWLLKRELQEMHEFEADNGVLNTGIDAKKYQLLLVKKAVGTRLYSMANGFNHSKLKKRITMMLKERTNRWARLKLLLVVPIMGGAIYAFAQPEVKRTLTPIVEEVAQKQQEDNYWELMNYFSNEEDAYRNRMKGKKGFFFHHNGLFINKENRLLFNGDYPELKDLQGIIEEQLYNSWKEHKKFTEVLVYQFDRSANESTMRDVFQSVKGAYTNIRTRIALESSNDNKAYLDSVFPILVRQAGPPKNYKKQVGAPKNNNKKETTEVISKATVTLHESPDGIKKELKDFTLEDLRKEIMAVKTTSKDSDGITIGLKVTKDCAIGVVEDIKQVLRECNALKVNYWIQ